MYGQGVDHHHLFDTIESSTRVESCTDRRDTRTARSLDVDREQWSPSRRLCDASSSGVVVRSRARTFARWRGQVLGPSSTRDPKACAQQQRENSLASAACHSTDGGRTAPLRPGAAALAREAVPRQTVVFDRLSDGRINGADGRLVVSFEGTEATRALAVVFGFHGRAIFAQARLDRVRQTKEVPHFVRENRL